MKKSFVALMLLTSASIYGASFETTAFRVCEKKESKCESVTIPSEVLEYEGKAIQSCVEISHLVSGERKVAYYECKIAVGAGKHLSAVKLRIKPATLLDKMVETGEAVEEPVKPKFDPSKPFTVSDP